MAKVGTPGTVKIRFNKETRASEVTTAVPMCTSCIVRTFKDAGNVGDTGRPYINSKGKPIGMAERLGPNARPKKWLGKRRRPK
jgi:hypothetical protein